MSDDRAAGGRQGEADDEAIELLTEAGQAKNTKKSTKYAVELLYDQCFWKELDPEFENRTASDLNKLLKQFYANVVELVVNTTIVAVCV